MSNEFNLESLSKTWQGQNTPKQINTKELKKRLLTKRIYLLTITLIELAILLTIAWLLIKAFNDNWAIYKKIGIVFALFSGAFAMVLMSKSRIKSYQMITSATIDWIKFEEKMSLEALRRSKYTNYLILAFSIGVGVAWCYEYFVLQLPLYDLALHYSFGVFWLTLCWLINRHKIKQHSHFLNSLN